MFRAIIREYWNKWWKIYLSDLSWIVLITLFSVYARYKISSYLSLINSYSNDFNIIKDEISNNTAAGAYKLQLLLSEVSPIVDRLNLFVFFIVPAIIFLVWLFFNTINYSIMRGEKFIKIFPAMALITIPFYLVFLSLSNIMLTIIRESFFSNWKFYVILALTLLLCYLLHVSYSFISINNLKRSLVEWLKASLFRLKSALPIFLLYSLSLALLFVSMLNIAIKYVTDNIGSTVWSFILALFSILAIGFTRNWLNRTLTK